MKILLADDHPIMREGIRHVLMQLEKRVTIIDSHDYPSLYGQAEVHPDLDLTLVDLNMPGSSGIKGVSEFRTRFPDIPLVVLSASESQRDIQSVLNAGAMGFIPKSSPHDVMLCALRKILAGEIYVPPLLTQSTSEPQSNEVSVLRNSGLTTRQIEVLRLLLHGNPNKVIARALDLTEGTIKLHIAAIFRALGVNNRTEAVLTVQKLGIDPDFTLPQDA